MVMNSDADTQLSRPAALAADPRLRAHLKGLRGVNRDTPEMRAWEAECFALLERRLAERERSGPGDSSERASTASLLPG